ncbi:MAG: hypothetical protein C5B55_13740 [Blastocatellia bacterium]|nr:MAG: hypothetical protein C5B55_13740 [Blastocatellia bacterium]
MKYIVKAGDTLSKIANRQGLTLAQLLDANPNFKANPGSLKVGSILTIPDELTTIDTQPTSLSSSGTTGAATATAAASAPAAGAVGFEVGAVLGSLSAKYETGDRGPGTVSSGSGDPGGVSYGSYQMATNTGTVKRFVGQPDFSWRAQFTNLTPGTAPFTAKWKEIAANEPVAFQASQHEYIKRTHFDLLVAKIQNDDGLNVMSHSKTLQDVVWSTSVQHGGGTPIIHRALLNVGVSQSDPDFDRQLINAVYAERGRRGADGKLVYFSKSRADVQASVAKRFRNEEADALQMLDNEV